MIVEEFAPAKLNLSLSVVGKRADGYHLLESLVAFADIGDRLTADVAPEFSLAIDGPFASRLDAGADNLVSRAASLFAERLRRRPDVALRLTKNLPVASGIGGGSADAAATLRALSILWAAPIPADLPAKLGADVPVCVAGVPAWMTGIGEIVAPAGALPDWGVVLVNPGVALATPAVFKARTGAFSTGGKFAPNLATIAAAGNDLEAPAIALVPAIADVLAGLRGLPGIRVARMSGSGATCFGLFDGPEAAALAAKALKAKAPSAWWIAAGRVA
jgi:4-diphosphocytidyl-2-C-methyl-D-erythritol kinase